ncbi:MAG: hypothetical protein QOJ40_2885 [Verrucomicrobiota bacterium]
MAKSLNFTRWQPLAFAGLLLLLLFTSGALQAETIILHLKNGDRIAGTIVSEDTNRVLITTPWIKELAVPPAQIERREKVVAATPPATNAPAATNVVAQTKASPPGQPAITNLIPSAAPGTPVAVMPVVQPKPQTPKPKHWKGELKIGADFLFGAKDQQIYYGRFKLVYERPYDSNPKQFFRNIFDYGMDYGWTETPGSTNSDRSLLSANRMDGNDKTDFDIGRRKIFVYNLTGAGYDQIRKIDLHYEEGPGVGYHLFTLTNFVMNTEAGFNYQVQNRSSTRTLTNGALQNFNTTVEKFYYRLAEDITWKFNKRFTLSEKLEFCPQAEDVQQFRARFESTVSYGIWQNVALNLSLLDMYDTQPTKSVPTIPRNDLQIRSSIGITF